MARQVIVNGNVPNDGAGDTLREGARKINENFIELYGRQLPTQSGNEGRFLKTNGTQSFWATLDVVNIPGNASTVTNGVYTTGSYNNPSWITALDGGKLTGTVVATNGVTTTGSYSNPAWITSLSFDKITGNIVATNGVVTTGSYINPSWIVSLDGSKLTGTVVATNGVVTNAQYVNPEWIISLDGGKVTNAVLTTGTYNNPSWINNLSGSKITGNITGNAGTVTNGVYTTQSYNDPSWITALSPTKVLPVQTGNNGKFLSTNGSTLSWADISIPPAFDQNLNTTDSVQFVTVTAEEFITDSPGTPEIFSDNDLNLTADDGAVIITSSVLRLKQFTNLEITAITGVNGDIIYNSDTNKFQGYANGSWVDLH